MFMSGPSENLTECEVLGCLEVNGKEGAQSENTGQEEISGRL